jgi:hypothetical protein
MRVIEAESDLVSHPGVVAVILIGYFLYNRKKSKVQEQVKNEKDEKTTRDKRKAMSANGDFFQRIISNDPAIFYNVLADEDFTEPKIDIFIRYRIGRVRFIENIDGVY